MSRVGWEMGGVLMQKIEFSKQQEPRPPPGAAVPVIAYAFLFSIVRFFVCTRRFTVRLSAKNALVFAVMALALPTAQADLIGHWTFDEASSGNGSGTVLDSSGNGYNGAISATNSAYYQYVPGHIGGGALQFNTNYGDYSGATSMWDTTPPWH